jgi:two-component system, sensor histidine kinase and response regulator
MCKKKTIQFEMIEKLQKIGGSTLVKKMLAIFFENTPLKIDEMLFAHKNGDLKQISQAAHSLQSSSGNLGAFHMLAAARALEASADNAKTNLLEKQIQDVINTFNDAQIELERLTKDL